MMFAPRFVVAAALSLALLASTPSCALAEAPADAVDFKPIATIAKAEPVQDTVVRTQYSSPFAEIGKAFMRFVLGFVLVGFAFPVLWFNERRQAKMWELFGRAKSMAVADVSADKLDDANEGRLVHVVGVTSTEEHLKDEDLGVSVRDSTKLERIVSMYQWQENAQEEERDTMMGGKEKVTTYSYFMDWADYAVDSSQFAEEGHDNPPMPLEGKVRQAAKVNLGAFSLPKRLVAKMSNFGPLASEELPKQLSGRGISKTLELRGEGYTTEAEGYGPQLGDLKVRFQKVSCGDCTVLAVQSGNKLMPLTAKMEVDNGRVVAKSTGGGNDPLLAAQKLEEAANDDGPKLEDGEIGCCAACGLIGQAVEAHEEVFELAEEQATLPQMFTAAQEGQHMIHLILQIIGFLLFFIGFDMIFCFIPTIFRLIPLIGTWIQLFGNFLAHVAAFLLAGCFWCITVALAWFAARPFKTVLLLGAATLLIAVPTVLASYMGPQ